MPELIARFWQPVLTPDRFFERVREERGWGKPIAHLLILALLLGIESAAAWHAGIPGNTPINASLTAQMDVYRYWAETLAPRLGALAAPAAAGLIALEMIVIAAVYTPIIFLVFRYLGGAREPGGLLRAFQGFVYGLTPVVYGGALPWAALVVGVYATLLQLYRGPAITLRNRSLGAYLLVVAVLVYAIARYWNGGLL